MPAPRLPQDLPSVDYLRACFAYDPETGLLTWKTRPREHFSSSTGYGNFKSRYAGKPAGTLHNSGYLQVGVTPGNYLAHRICWAVYYGKWPTLDIDHINGIRTDNRIINLRDVSRQTNMRNAAKCSRNTSSGNGVTWSKHSEKWQAQVTMQGKNHYLGLFDDIADAVSARQRANEQFGFSPRHGQDMVQLPNS